MLLSWGFEHVTPDLLEEFKFSESSTTTRTEMSSNLGLLATSAGPASSGAPPPVSLPFVFSPSGLEISPQWRNFPFFNDVPVKDVHDLDSSPDIFKVCL